MKQNPKNPSQIASRKPKWTSKSTGKYSSVHAQYITVIPNRSNNEVPQQNLQSTVTFLAVSL